MSAPDLIVDRDRYLAIRAQAATVFRLEARLPGQVFKRDASDPLFGEFDAVLAPDLWPALCAMARWHGDQWIQLLVIDPDGDSYYFPKHKMYPAVSLSVEANVDDYWAAIGHDPLGTTYESIAITANVIAVTRASGNWGCWGEREAEVAIFHGFHDTLSRSDWRDRFGPFLEVSEALESYFPWSYTGRAAPNRYIATMTANYGRRDGTQP